MQEEKQKVRNKWTNAIYIVLQKDNKKVVLQKEGDLRVFEISESEFKFNYSDFIKKK